MTQIPNKHFNTLVVGGGIVGAGIFRDLSLHKISTLLIDRNDFSSQTSQSSSKMLHGGIRYLENLDLKLVWEALHEKSLWLKLLPHLTEEKKFILPIFKESRHPKFLIHCGLFLYDLLSAFQNSPYQILTKTETLKYLPSLKPEGLKGAGLYYDAVMDDIKITLEVIYDGIYESENQAISHIEFINFQNYKDKYIVQVRDTIKNQEHEIQVKNIIFATGPFTDKLLGNIMPKSWHSKLIPSKGSHLWLKKNSLMINAPMVINNKDGRVIFVIPKKNAILVGTTEVDITENFFNITPSKKEIDYLLRALNDYFPSDHVNKEDIISSFSGVRPLIKEDDESSKGSTARNHKIYQPASNIYVVLGGKYTTFRIMGQEVTRQIVNKTGKTYNSEKSKSPLRQKSTILPFQKWAPNTEDIAKILKTESPRTFEDLIIRRIGIPSIAHWNNLYQVDFKDFFFSMTNTTEHEIKFNETEINNFLAKN